VTVENGKPTPPPYSAENQNGVIPTTLPKYGANPDVPKEPPPSYFDVTGGDRTDPPPRAPGSQYDAASDRGSIAPQYERELREQRERERERQRERDRQFITVR
jgi:hypothetical protein